MSQKDKVKARLTTLDINALVTELKQKLIGMRLANVYNVDNKTYVFKFSKTEQKEFLIIENGVRFNLTDEAGFQKSKMPSGFTMKFRKFLRSRRVEAIEQIGIERVVVLTFGQEEYTSHLILELYSQGNIIMTDRDYRVIQLTRQHQFSETAKVAPGEIYPFEHTATIYLEKIDTSIEHIQAVLDKQSEQPLENVASQEPEVDKKGQKKAKKPATLALLKLKEIVFKIIPCFHLPLIDDLIKSQALNPNDKTQDIQVIKKMVDFSYDYLITFCKQQKYKGYLIASSYYLNQDENVIKDEQSVTPVLDDKELPVPKVEEKKIRFYDFVAQTAFNHQGKYIEETASFNEAVDKYFRTLDRSEEPVNVEEVAWKKFENIKQDQDNRIKKLQVEQDEYQIKAQLIEDHISDVEAILDILQKMVDGGLQWDKIAKMINESKKDGDPLANMIHEMNFKNNRISVLLGDETSTDDLTSVELDLKLTAYQNQRRYYEHKKKFGQKEKKTKEAAKGALKLAEKTALKEIERETQKQRKVHEQRKKYWFEKFFWFISTDGYLVISGRDVQQNELVVKKYLGKDDLYVHADMYGSTSTVIKNPEGKMVPDNTLMQAGTATMCRSKAWDSKIVVSAWWVNSSQVSKSAPTGLNLSAGSFMIYGKKNFVHPPRLEMGYTLLFALDQDSIAKHAQERQLKLEVQSESQTQKDETEIEVSETTEKNVFDTDEEDSGDEKEPVKEPEAGSKTMTLTKDQLKSIGQSENTEMTIVEVNPNAKLMQIKLQQKAEWKAAQLLQKSQPDQKKVQPDQRKTQPDQKGKNKGKAPYSKVIQKVVEVEDSNRQVRGKKGQNQKIKDKYSDQSDEEREVRMQLMGAQETKQMKKNKQMKPPQEKEEIYIKPTVYDPDSKKQTITEILLQQQNIEVQKEVVVVEDKKEEQQEMILSSEDEKEQEQEKEDDTNIDNEYKEMQKLVSYLYSDDNYIALVPMCAPYQVIANNKYKMKVNPGTLKKGKAAKEIVNFFTNNKDSNVHDKRLIKMITDEEVVANLMSGVKLTGQGMLQMKQKEKLAKKASQKPKPNKVPASK